MDISKYTDKLMVLKKRKEITISTLISQLKKRRQETLDETRKVDENISSRKVAKVSYVKSFYAELKTITFSNKNMLGLELALKKFELEQQELSLQKQALVDQLKEIDDEIEQEKNQLKLVIRQQEKYNYIKSNYNLA